MKINCENNPVTKLVPKDQYPLGEKFYHKKVKTTSFWSKQAHAAKQVAFIDRFQIHKPFICSF